MAATATTERDTSTRCGIPKNTTENAKAAEFARLGDFFARLVSGDHKSLYEEVSRTPRKKPNVTRSQRLQPESPSPSKPSKESILCIPRPLDPIPLIRTVSSESTTSISTTCTASTGSSSTDAYLSSPPSSVSSFPTSPRCDDVACSDSSDEEDEEPTRGRTRTRSTAGRFRKLRPQPLTYTAQFPGGSFSSYMPYADSAVKDKDSMGGKFTFKMMLHELYEDVDEFRAMVEKVLEESKKKYRPLEKVNTNAAHGKEGASGKSRVDEMKNEDGKTRDRAISNLEGKGQMEMVRNVVERAKKKRRIRTGEQAVPQETERGPVDDSESQSQKITYRKYILRERVSSAASTEGAANVEQRVPRDGVRHKVLDEQGPHAVSIRPRMKRRLST
ncbi:hypothetical protein BC629DRAFT_25748 [Irpex lacteus]|nr:hypothetical protein BC629DRAFT_25748 [Irpex lacteus]